ncbi:MAG: hypothetical protein PHZ27_03685 [Candidatus Omnitrophica bacterium]|jgi:hypothetical protein|nr:hypothetical protein [Candidatus Omnitrophota bacterium]
MRKYLFVVGFSFIIVMSSVLANGALDNIKHLLLFDNTKINIARGLESFKGQRVTGYGFVKSISMDMNEKYFCYIYTDKDKQESIDILLFFRKSGYKRFKGKFNPGDEVFFSGKVDDIKMDMLVLTRGNLK